MNDVLPECGGYLPVYIDQGGYIYGIETMRMVHRETRQMNDWGGHFERFTDAKSYVVTPNDEFSTHEEFAVLELTPEGGGAALWMHPEQVDELSARRDKWKGCYGSWPIRTFTI